MSGAGEANEVKNDKRCGRHNDGRKAREARGG
jgi:hypothetical protein